MIKLDILSDPICPWCYIGWTNLARAMEARPNHPFTIEWHPFQLNPDMPPEGRDRRAYLENKFGGKEGFARAYAPVVEKAEEAGLKINLESIDRTPNTLNAHRLIHWAGIEGRQTPAVLALFRAYFVEGRDIGDIPTLVDIAESVGLDRNMIAKLYEGDADAQSIRDRDAHARSRGVQAVPTFIVASQHAVPGAQPPAQWEAIIDDLNEQLDRLKAEEEAKG
ncbi:thioredoxin domain-containing protein [Rhodobacterales bacterium HKCCE4037]|nr:thioredoxin domain-containing protein [Rhodobacterales bacterium HKCCE4037]